MHCFESIPGSRGGSFGRLMPVCWLPHGQIRRHFRCGFVASTRPGCGKVSAQNGVAEGVISIISGAHPLRIHEVAPLVKLIGRRECDWRLWREQGCVVGPARRCAAGRDHRSDHRAANCRFGNRDHRARCADPVRHRRYHCGGDGPPTPPFIISVFVVKLTFGDLCTSSPT